MVTDIPKIETAIDKERNVLEKLLADYVKDDDLGLKAWEIMRKVVTREISSLSDCPAGDQRFVEDLLKLSRGCIAKMMSQPLPQFLKWDVFATSPALAMIACAMLDPSEGELVLDISKGAGSFSFEAASISPDANYLCMGEFQGEEIETAEFRRSLLSSPRINFKNAPLFYLNRMPKADRLFINQPHFSNISEPGGAMPFLMKHHHWISMLKNYDKMQSDWAYALYALGMIKKNGAAVCLFSKESLSSEADRPMREYFVRRGFIRTILALPRRIHYDTRFSPALVMLSRGNLAIHMIDVSQKKWGASGSKFSGLDRDEVSSLIFRDKTNRRFVIDDKIRESSWKLAPSHYIGAQAPGILDVD